VSQSFTLRPFEKTHHDLAITGTMNYHSGQLSISYEITGDLSKLLIPPPVDIPVRQLALWEATCLEFFLAPVVQPNYWEFNLAPSGNWQVFKLDSYRQGLRDEEVLESLPFAVEVDDLALKLKVSIDLTKIISAQIPLEISVTAVIQDIDGDFSYWAIDHAGTSADFHLRDSFKNLVVK
jgi:hypothetical protein